STSSSKNPPPPAPAATSNTASACVPKHDEKSAGIPTTRAQSSDAVRIISTGLLLVDMDIRARVVSIISRLFRLVRGRGVDFICGRERLRLRHRCRGGGRLLCSRIRGG